MVGWVAAMFESGNSSCDVFADALALALGAPRIAGLPRSGPGVVLFDRPTPDLHAFLAGARGSPDVRVLAAGIGAGSLLAGESWSLLSAGAADAVALPLDEGRAISRVKARISRWCEIEQVVSSALVTENLVGRSPAFLSLLRQLVELSRHADAPVLLLGESGTGKELAARLVHALDPRPNKRDLVVVDCTTIVPELSGSELFGHERGAFTGAVGARDGAFALADGGTLFLDEVGELPPPLQAQLLRVVQEKTFKRVGGNAWYKTDFRLVCATNRDLLGEVARGQFRRDLYYRIAGTVCRMPSLAERNGDILDLAQHFWRGMCLGREVPPFDDDVRAYLLSRAYPGNVRDLRQVVTRMFYRHVGEGPVTVGDVPEDERPVGEAARGEWQSGQLDDLVRRALALGVGLKEIGRVAEEVAIKVAVQEEEGNLQRAAVRLGVTDRALQMRRAQRKQMD